MKNYIIEKLKQHHNTSVDDKLDILKSDFKYQDILSLAPKYSEIRDIKSVILSKPEDIKFIDFETSVAEYHRFECQKYSLRISKNLIISDYHEISEILKDHSENSYVVGGFTRDSILGLDPKDADFVTDISYDRLEHIFRNHNYTIDTYGKQFLVLKVSKVLENGQKVQADISNFRTESNYKDGRRPSEVDIGDIFSDSSRRDFSINSLYFNLSTYTLEDPTKLGILDISEKTLRFIGKPKERLEEDALRAFRFYRLLKTKKLDAHPKSLRAIRELFADCYVKSDPQRVREEIEKMVLTK